MMAKEQAMDNKNGPPRRILALPAPPPPVQKKVYGKKLTKEQK